MENVTVKILKVES